MARGLCGSLLLVLLISCSDDAATDGDSGVMDLSPAVDTQASVDGPAADTSPPFLAGLIGWWRFDEGSGLTAGDSAGNNTGSLENGVQWTTGKVGQAVLFDGVDDVVSIPDADVFDFGTGDFTVSAWFKTASSKDHHIVNLRQDDNDPHIELYAAPPPFGYLGTHLLPGDTRISYDAQAVDDDVWHHAAAVLKSGEPGGYRLYFDGKLVGQSTYSEPLANWDTIHIGDMADGKRAFDGAIDEVMIFNRALSDQQMLAVYQYVAGGG